MFVLSFVYFQITATFMWQPNIYEPDQHTSYQVLFSPSPANMVNFSSSIITFIGIPPPIPNFNNNSLITSPCWKALW